MLISVIADPGCFISDPDPNNFPSRIRTFFIPDPESYIKKRDSNKNYWYRVPVPVPFFLLFMVLGASLNRQKDPDPGSRIHNKFIPDPDPGGKNPGSRSATMADYFDFGREDSIAQAKLNTGTY
jgi:hypothetical protein